jgi:hypothetical protein
MSEVPQVAHISTAPITGRAERARLYPDGLWKCRRWTARGHRFALAHRLSTGLDNWLRSAASGTSLGLITGQRSPELENTNLPNPTPHWPGRRSAVLHRGLNPQAGHLYSAQSRSRLIYVDAPPRNHLTSYINSYTMTPTGAALLHRHPLHFLTAADRPACGPPRLL